MRDRVATCRCGQLKALCTGEPVSVTVCHCLDCQRRSGSAFAIQARWTDDCVSLEGESRKWSLRRDSGLTTNYWICPICGGIVAYTNEDIPGVTAIPGGAFSDPNFPTPTRSIWEHRKHSWLNVVGDGIKHVD